METTNSDLQQVIDSLGAIVPILEQIIPIQGQEPEVPFQATLPSVQGQEPEVPLDVGDLDLLLYENPTI